MIVTYAIRSTHLNLAQLEGTAAGGAVHQHRRKGAALIDLYQRMEALVTSCHCHMDTRFCG